MTPAAPPHFFGCRFEAGRSRFRLRAPGAAGARLVIRGAGEFPMRVEPNGFWTLERDVPPGTRYAFAVDGGDPFPDPASRSQPDGVHAFSEAIDTASFAWRHPFPVLPPPARRTLYELHVGAFSPGGTFDGARALLPRLRDLGASLIEILPVAAFPGTRNWGYDGVSLFAPAACYGRPESLAALVDAAHDLGLGVILDVVYNHFGPDGNYLPGHNREFFDPALKTPWGDAVNLDGPGGEHTRAFLIDNALHWLRDYRFDGLRLDATHALRDGPDRPFTAQLRRAVDAALPDRTILLYAEDERHPARFCRALETGGSGLDGVWADDWHHHVRRRVAGDREGYFARYDGTMENIAATLRDGWQHEEPDPGAPEGCPPANYDKFVICLQNHDQIGNRALGERLHHQIAPELWRALSAMLLLAPETPLLFMGQEWAASAPFLYFTAHHAALGRLVTEGRRREFAGFSAFRDPGARGAIPDPQAVETFLRSKPDWSEADREPHAAVLRLYRALLRLRTGHPAAGSAARGDFHAEASGDDGIAMIRKNGGNSLACAVWLGDAAGRVDLPETAAWTPLLTTEDPEFAVGAPRAVATERDASGRTALRFARAGAWIAEEGRA